MTGDNTGLICIKLSLRLNSAKCEFGSGMHKRSTCAKADYHCCKCHRCMNHARQSKHTSACSSQENILMLLLWHLGSARQWCRSGFAYFTSPNYCAVPCTALCTCVRSAGRTYSSSHSRMHTSLHSLGQSSTDGNTHHSQHSHAHSAIHGSVHSSACISANIHTHSSWHSSAGISARGNLHCMDTHVYSSAHCTACSIVEIIGTSMCKNRAHRSACSHARISARSSASSSARRSVCSRLHKRYAHQAVPCSCTYEK